MTEVKGIELPGVGVRYEFVTEEGKRVGVVSHRSGRREIYLADRDDPDRFQRVLGLGEKDARTLAEALGASSVAEELAELHQKIEGASHRLASGARGPPLPTARLVLPVFGHAPVCPSWRSCEVIRRSRRLDQRSR